PDALTAHVRFWEGAKLNRSSSKLYAKLERESPLYSPPSPRWAVWAMVTEPLGLGYRQRYRHAKGISSVAKKPTIQALRSFGPSMLLFSLKPLLASTKSRQLHANYRTMAAALAGFLQGNGLTTRTLLDSETTVSEDFAITAGDLTDEGLALYRDAEQAWLKSLDKSRCWDDTAKLQTCLERIRSNPYS
ncbi:MAG: hypothetical protein KDB22_10815, partial [Planctomycetales bacterium]|nr:hypothetical protein [Planctomycetales bacterium]